MSVGFICLASFLIGGIPFGFLVGRFVLKDDIRNHGSGNIGATNVGRVIGWKWGGFVLLLDALKGLGPTAFALWFSRQHLSDSLHLHVAVAAGICSIVGHMYPIYLKLRGGKGAATALGVVVVLAPKAVGIALLAFLLTAGVTRVVALASIVAATTFGIAELWILGKDAFNAPNLMLTMFAVGIPILIIWRHRSNIQRLIHGTEPPVTESAAPIPESGNGESAEGENSVDGSTVEGRRKSSPTQSDAE